MKEKKDEMREKVEMTDCINLMKDLNQWNIIFKSNFNAEKILFFSFNHSFT